MYPSGAAELFVARPEEEIERAVSPKGVSYSAQSYAFAYRKSFVPACKAQLTLGLDALASRFNGAQEKDIQTSSVKKADRSAPVPVPRPSTSEDPETLANVAGGFSLERPAEIVATASDPEVRVVGADRFVPTLAIDGHENRDSSFARHLDRNVRATRSQVLPWSGLTHSDRAR